MKQLLTLNFLLENVFLKLTILLEFIKTILLLQKIIKLMKILNDTVFDAAQSPFEF